MLRLIDKMQEGELMIGNSSAVNTFIQKYF